MYFFVVRGKNHKTNMLARINSIYFYTVYKHLWFSTGNSIAFTV